MKRDLYAEVMAGIEELRMARETTKLLSVKDLQFLINGLGRLASHDYAMACKAEDHVSRLKWIDTVVETNRLINLLTSVLRPHKQRPPKRQRQQQRRRKSKSAARAESA